ncbi:LuxR C-terminal-related transcriptional regulator [Nocardioides sediminis]|uniref:LuxR C-terminal-related transcriptional regulator n=1 Tax=Nocardioides sediminis TaxID=433648 RepID=UPI000D30F141|nr:LuxR C-terminal-related transcriptional regulator [Nocardioides sediminis]
MSGAAEPAPGAAHPPDPGDLLGTRDGWYGVPGVPRVHVRRERLLEELGRGDGPLVLVSAPAGSGKTTLVADWVSSRPVGRVAWLTLDDPATGVWPGLVDALVGLGVPLSATSPPAGTSALEPGMRHRIAATVAAEESPVTVVLDGDLPDSAEVAADLDFLLRHSGRRLRLVLLTRADPLLPLYRYRLEDAMAEIRMDDLAFTDEEAAQLLRGMDLPLSTEAVHVLTGKTRGWVTGLRFAAKMLAHRDDPEAGAAEVAGHTGNIAEYLMGEVLAAHPPELRRVLMATSIPDIVCPGLAEALAGRGASRALADLTRGNAFLEQVPGHPGCYRYHPLFRELLRAELDYADPDAVEPLQRRAAGWFADEGMLAPAVHHLVAARAWRQAAQLVVDRLAVGQLLLADRTHPLVEALRAMPAAVDDPAAHVVRATLELVDGDTGRADHLLGALDRIGAGTPTAEPVSVAVAVLRAVHARSDDDAGEAWRLAEVAERSLKAAGTGSSPAVPPEVAALVGASKGAAAMRLGRLEDARVALEHGVEAALRASTHPLVVECLGHLALIACCAGEVTHAEALAVRALAAADDAGIRPADRPAAPYVAGAWAAVEHHELRVAAEQVRSAERAGLLLGDPVPRCLLALVTSRVQEARGDRGGALARVREVAHGLGDKHRWLVDRLRVEEARLLVAGREPRAALAVVADVGRTGAEAEAALVLVQAHLRRGDAAAAETAMVDVLGRQVPPAVRVSGWLAECARQLGRGSTPRARRALATGLELAASQRLRRPFHEAPAAVQQLFLHDPRLTTQHPWLLETGALAGRAVPSPRRPAPAGAVRQPPVMVEALTGKEREVLVHLAELLTTEEIAAAMYVSVNTVRTHVRNILRKLGVNSRNGAVRAARERELLPRG